MDDFDVATTSIDDLRGVAFSRSAFAGDALREMFRRASPPLRRRPGEWDWLPTPVAPRRLPRPDPWPARARRSTHALS